MSSKRFLGVYARGVAMGAADVVPGVSGGTVAFITGIYEELLNTIKAINPESLMILFREGPRAFWWAINGSFLLALGLGIATSIFSLARLITVLLDNYPLLVWSFFFGLIIASALHIARQINQWNILKAGALMLGAVMAYLVAELKPAELPPELGYVFMAGCVAICAMILPGISGSFILVLLGMYSHVLVAIKEFEWLLLITFAAGCGVGLLSFSHLLSWLLSRFHDGIMALLTGFLVGSLYLVWPWKQTLSTYQNSHGKTLALEQQNVWPGQFFELTGQQPETAFCTILVLSGVVIVVALEKFGHTAVEGK